MNTITTKCQGCIFDKGKCLIDKDTIKQDKETVVDGFCRFKRLKEWDTIKELTKEGKIKRIQEEEQKLTAIIIINNLDMGRLIKTLKSLKNNVIEVIVTTCDFAKQDINRIVNIMRDSELKWRLNNVDSSAEHQEMNDWSLVDRILSFNINSNWFITLYSGDEISPKVFDFFSKIVTGKHNNLICLYFEEKETIKLIVNKNAFHDFSGNIETSFFDKVKSLDNWRQVCSKIY